MPEKYNKEMNLLNGSFELVTKGMRTLFILQILFGVKVN
jgi:hypothetical protein